MGAARRLVRALGGSLFFNGIAVRELPTFTGVVSRVTLAAVVLPAPVFELGVDLHARKGFVCSRHECPALRRTRMVGLGFRRLGRQRFDLRSCLLLGQAHVVERLQVHPELRAAPEPVCKAKSGIARDGALAVDDLADAVRRDADLPRQLGGADAKLLKLFGEDFAGVNGCAGHGQTPFSGRPRFRRSRDRFVRRAIRSKSATAC